MKSLLAFFAVVFLVSGISGLVTAPSVAGWYQTLSKPAHNPPDWVFGPVWTTLYIMIAISGWLVWQKLSAPKLATPQMRFYGANLLANFLWSILFFGLQNPLLAFIDINLMLIFITANIFYFYKISKPAAYLQIPYLLWVAYATTLNGAIVWLN
jgi:tryptophan-rich sensory protein